MSESPILPDVFVTVEPPLPEVQVHIEDTPEIVVEVSDVALAGREATDVGGVIHTHINSPTPHPVYDDGPSFELLYQNAKV